MMITIITVCKNAESSIERTIKSVFTQDYKNIEYIIVDGSSTDNTMNMVNKYNSVIDKIISEPDFGIYDAMNKGLRLAKGDYIYFLNADDYFVNSKVLSEVVNLIQQNSSKHDIYYGYCLYTLDDKAFSTNKDQLENINKQILVYDNFDHQATFFKKSVFDKYGLYNTSFTLAGDYEFFMRIFVSRKVRFKFIDLPVAIYNINHTLSFISKAGVNRQKYLMERKRVFDEYYSSLEKSILKNKITRKLLFPGRIEKIFYRLLKWDLIS